jgi:hypothetical protein
MRGAELCRAFVDTSVKRCVHKGFGRCSAANTLLKMITVKLHMTCGVLSLCCLLQLFRSRPFIDGRGWVTDLDTAMCTALMLSGCEPPLSSSGTRPICLVRSGACPDHGADNGMQSVCLQAHSGLWASRAAAPHRSLQHAPCVWCKVLTTASSLAIFD